MSISWREKIRRAERSARPVGLPVQLSLQSGIKARFLEEAKALHLHPNQLASQIVERWIVDRKRAPSFIQEVQS